MVTKYDFFHIEITDGSEGDQGTEGFLELTHTHHI